MTDAIHSHDVAMKPVSHAEREGFETRLHFRTRPVTTSTRAARRLTQVLLALAARMKFLGSINLASILVDETEKILNLPGDLPFFPTKTTDIMRAHRLIRQLHPIVVEKGLVRLGPNADGGYLVPNDLVGIEACFSPGVSNVSGFERDCAEMGMKVFMADASVEQPQESHAQFDFVKKFIGSVSHGDFISLSDWVESSLPNSRSELLLQMDIEGYEYETFLSTPRTFLERFRIIVVEFHNLDCLFSEPIFPFYSKAFEKILDTHTCVHIHPNNVCNSIRVRGLEAPQLAEFTFLRNDRVTSRTFATEFPHRLDRHNFEERSPLRLPTSWYRA